MICRRAFAASLGLAAMLASSHAFAGVIVQNIAGTLGSGSGFFFGQSFTTPSSGGPWDDITFNFFTNVPPTTAEASGNAFLLSQQYLGTPSNLSSSTPGFLAESTVITGGMHVFSTALELSPGTQYFVYENAVSPNLSGGNTISGGQLYFAGSSSDFAGGGRSNNFTVSGDVVSAAVSEPSPLMVLVIALLGFGLLRRYRASG
jgi:hypothetical protein